MIDDVVGAYVTGATSEGYAEDWDLDQLWSSLKQLYPVGVTVEELEEEVGSRAGLDQDFLLARLKEDAHAAYDRREEQLGEEAVRQLERMVLLQVIDRKWREHLYEMDYLQEGISLRAYAQRDPVIEYQREGFDMFATMMDGIKEETVGFLYNLEVQVQEPEPEAEEVQLLEKPVEIRAKGLNRAPQQQGLQYSAPAVDGEAGRGAPVIERNEQQAPALGVGGGRESERPAAAGPRRAPAGLSGQAVAASSARRSAPGQTEAGEGPSRNAPCPCGSGRKYKRCHGAPNGAK
jgi:preprotein translocase subunit SecA